MQINFSDILKENKSDSLGEKTENKTIVEKLEAGYNIDRVTLKELQKVAKQIAYDANIIYDNDENQFYQTINRDDFVEAICKMLNKQFGI